MHSLLSGLIWVSVWGIQMPPVAKQRPHCMSDWGFNSQATEGLFSWGNANLAGPQMPAPAFFLVPGDGHASSLGWASSQTSAFHPSVLHQEEEELLGHQELWSKFILYLPFAPLSWDSDGGGCVCMRCAHWVWGQVEFESWAKRDQRETKFCTCTQRFELGEGVAALWKSFFWMHHPLLILSMRNTLGTVSGGTPK